MVELARAFLQSEIPSTILCGEDFSDQRYKNLRLRFLLRLSKSDHDLVVCSTYVDDALDFVRALPGVSIEWARSSYARILQVAFATFLALDSLADLRRQQEEIRRTTDLDIPSEPSSDALLGSPSRQRGRSSWYSFVVSPVTVRSWAGWWQRIKRACDLSMQLLAPQERLIFALMHLERGLRGRREDVEFARSLMVYHAVATLKQGTGWVKQAHKRVLKTRADALPLLTSTKLENLVADVKKSPERQDFCIRD